MKSKFALLLLVLLLPYCGIAQEPKEESFNWKKCTPVLLTKCTAESIAGGVFLLGGIGMFLLMKDKIKKTYSDPMLLKSIRVATISLQIVFTIGISAGFGWIAKKLLKKAARNAETVTRSILISIEEADEQSPEDQSEQSHLGSLQTSQI